MTTTKGMDLDDLRRAIADNRHKDVRSLVESYCDEVRASQQCPPDADKVLTALRNGWHFDLMSSLGALLVERNPSSKVVTLYAQSLIELGRTTEAIRLLLDADRAEGEGETSSEIRGLLGRAYKQIYVDAAPNAAEPRSADFEKALAYYEGIYQIDAKRYYWHGINVAALLHRHASVMPPDEAEALREKAREICRSLLDDLETRIDEAAGGPIDPFLHATAMEACIPLEELRYARHCDAYLMHEDTTAFHVQSTLRQLRQLWGLTVDQEPGSYLLPTLIYALKEKGRVSVDLLENGRPERIFSDASCKPIDWYARGLVKAAAIGRIGYSEYEGEGTCFLVSPIHVLTNWHVSPRDLVPERARVVFQAAREGSDIVRRRVKKMLWTGGNTTLDVTLLELDAPVEGAEPLQLRADASGQMVVGGRAYVIGYPLGGSLSISLHDSRVVGKDERVIHYRTPTNPGSSGSPVFDEDWYLVAIHHMGDKYVRSLQNPNQTYEANEGILVEQFFADVIGYLPEAKS